MRSKCLRAFSLLLAFILLTALSPEAYMPGAQASAGKELRGVWVASVINLDYPSKPGLSVDELKKEAAAILDGAKDLGYNAVFLQVRPTGDALYKSSLFPWSYFLTGSQGIAPAGGFDPLKYWIEQAHERGLEIHAWVNPFRITQGSASNKQHDVNLLALSNPARKNPGWTVAHTDGRLYYNPGIPEVRKLVIDGIVEIVKNYDIDGIHYDDYFYPGKDFGDDAAFKAHGAGFKNKDDWRRNNIDELIRDTYNAVHAEKKGIVFGVSPFAIWCNQSTNRLGSDTRGSESYVTQYADTRKWVKNNWLDYIAPQIYWNIGFDVADYAKLLPWWVDVVAGTNVKLYIGTAAYRAGESSTAGHPWNGAEEIVRQAELNKKYPAVSGVIHFRYGSLTASKALRDAVARVFGTGAAQGAVTPKNDPALNLPSISRNTLTVGRPTSGTLTTNESTYYILGTYAQGGKPPRVNGKDVTDLAGGYFGYHAQLSVGANTFAFSQEGQKNVSVTITRKAAAVTKPTPMGTIEIPAGSVFPRSEHEYRRPGETVTLTCTAPIGADVKVTVGTATYSMTPAARQSPGTGAYPTTYTYRYTYPSTTTTQKVVTIGTPKYSMTYNGKTYTRNAGGALMSVTPGAPFYATVTADNAYVYPNGTTTGGPSGELVKGQKDYVTAVSGNGAWVRLDIGGWVQAADVSVKTESAALKAGLASAAYTAGNSVDTLTVKGAALTASSVAFDGKTITLTLSSANSAPKLNIPAGGVISSGSSSVVNGRAVYTLTVRAGEKIDGCYLTASGNNLTLNIKRRPKAASGGAPLSGIHILLDPGHGGTDSGAIGPMGARLAEKHLNWFLALKLKADLESKGARVSMTRSGDTLPSLNDRVEASRRLRPDMFISLHTNSVSEATDSGNIRGFETFYRNGFGKEISDLLLASVKTDSVYGNRRSNQANFFVLRPEWTPSALIETGFISNPSEFARLADDGFQYKTVGLITDAVVKYFS